MSAPILSGSKSKLSTGFESNEYVINSTDLLIGYTDPDGDNLSITNLSCSIGTLTDNSDGTW